MSWSTHLLGVFSSGKQQNDVAPNVSKVSSGHNRNCICGLTACCKFTGGAHG